MGLKKKNSDGLLEVLVLYSSCILFTSDRKKTLYDYWSLLGSFSCNDATLTTNVLMKSVLDDLRVLRWRRWCYVHVVKSTRLTVGQCSIFCILKAVAFVSWRRIAWSFCNLRIPYEYSNGNSYLYRTWETNTAVLDCRWPDVDGL